MSWAAYQMLAIASMIFVSGACVLAENGDQAKLDYQSFCAACHGMEAKGNGPVSKALKTPPADLTVLAKNNNGVFPFERVYRMVDGRNSSISAHGTREMPIWGYRFGPTHAYRLKNRVLAVIDYLKRVQEK
ncbi:c-type cytochrome [Rhodoplanes sp. Z2-YC6860]|uniref:c-type cytochrome n=1 Tax=Rhodoplanes sp. Z2-YC6860 TaxID=674703 RepID=UPI0009FE0540|nr:cytochrome c [Rhodoplanes sp. Z2-YC6860]